jgi:dihydrofolate reductase
MKCSAFIATSADGYIAKSDGGVEWLESSGNLDVDMSEYGDMGFSDYFSSVDCMIMGRKCMEVIASFNLTPEQWPYGDTRIIALSSTIKEAPKSLPGRVEMYSGDINLLLSSLEGEGYKHAYIDGGATIQSFLKLERINEITITQVPLLLGGGIPLFGKMDREIKLENAEVTSYPNDFIQIKYGVGYN